MKIIVFVVLLVTVIVAGYFFMGKPDLSQVVAMVEESVTSADVTETEEVENTMTSVDTALAEENTSAEESMITPADMSEEAQNAMYVTITDYNKCMMKNRLEYHQKGIRVANVADKTLQACEPHLEQMKAVLEANNVNTGLTKKMVHSMRSRAARKLMAAVMQSMAGQAAAMANTPKDSAPVSE